MADITSNLTHYWAFDDGSGSTATDSAGSNNGTLVGSPTWITGAISGGLSLNGSSQYVTCGSFTAPTSAITLAIWCKVVAFQSTSPFISSALGMEKFDTGSAMIRFGDATLAKEKAQFVLTIAGTARALAGSTSFPTGEWFHVAATFDGTTMCLYANGVLDTSTTSFSGSIGASGNFWIGNNPQSTTRFLNGAVDDARVYSRALSADDIAALYALGAGGGASPITVSVPAASLTWAANVPKVLLTNRIRVPTASLSWSAKVPTIINPNTIAIPKANMSWAALTPTVTVSANRTISVPAASLSWSAKVPTVSQTANNLIKVPVASLTWSPKVPTVLATANVTIQVPQASFHWTALAPTVDNGAPVNFSAYGGVAGLKTGESVVDINYTPNGSNLDKSSSVSTDKTDGVVKQGWIPS